MEELRDRIVPTAGRRVAGLFEERLLLLLVHIYIYIYIYQLSRACRPQKHLFGDFWRLMFQLIFQIFEKVI